MPFLVGAMAPVLSRGLQASCPELWACVQVVATQGFSAACSGFLFCRVAMAACALLLQAV